MTSSFINAVDDQISLIQKPIFSYLTLLTSHDWILFSVTENVKIQIFVPC